MQTILETEELLLYCQKKPPPLLCVHAGKQKATLAKSGLTSLATAAGGMYCVSVCVCLCVFTSVCACVCVCQDEVTWLLSWAVREDPASCCQSSTNKNHKRWTTMHPGWQPLPLRVPPCFVLCAVLPPPSHALAHTHAGTPDHAKADLEMKNDPPLAVHCCISSQLWSGGSGQILFKKPLSVLL